jgi:ribonuclease HI
MPETKQIAILIFCDGACSGNPGPGGWGAIVSTPGGEVWELGGGARSTTNNQMELTAATEALTSIASLPGEVVLFTDSVYVIKGITQWIWGWKRNGWKSAEGNDVANREYWEKLLSAASPRGKALAWKYVPGHSGVPGNERADTIAVSFAKGTPTALYRGAQLGYRVDLNTVTDVSALPKKSTKGQRKAYSYLSLVGQIAMRHSTWAECEARVKGQSGAKFKKVASQEEESEVLQSWGTQLKDL